MKIGLYNLEPKIENTTMMQVSQFHKQQGDEVEIYSPIFHDTYNKVYAFSIFDFTKKHYMRDSMLKGGTGFSNISRKLPQEIENCDLDYSIFPDCDTSYIWFSRGCIRRCPFCIVHKKEGRIKPVEPKNLNPRGRSVSIMDNNFIASPDWKKAIETLQDWEQPVNFQCGIDMRVFKTEHGESLKTLKLEKQLAIAWDNPKDDLRENIRHLLKFIPAYKVRCYVLIGYWSTPEEDLFRVEELRKLKVDPFAMPYSKEDRYQKDFARWVNRKAIFKSVPWEDYRK